jgi:hypothetical protein
MQKKTANELLNFLISLFTVYLEELSSASALDEDQFCYGEKPPTRNVWNGYKNGNLPKRTA